MRKNLLFFLFSWAFLYSTQVAAYHIVGGEIELVHVDGFTYDLNLIQYFDAAQTNNTNPDASAVVYIYKNGSSTMVETVVLTRIANQSVPYTLPECAIGELITNRLLFTRRVTFNPELYSDPAGYYAVWERCCRNAAIVNVSNTDGVSVGMTYALEFPAIMKDGEQFINSSPQLFPPLSDYACVNQTYYTSFAGIDVDGDSIAYSLKAPLNSSSNNPLPTPSPKPHFPVQFADGFSEDNMVPGNPALRISNQGFLTVRPFFTGLYVFSVLAEEFRDGIKIGQVTRDFQMLVVDGCNPPAPPDAVVKLPEDNNFYNEVDTITFTVADEKCFEFLVTDDIGDLVTFKAEGVNFEQDVEDIFSFDQAFINREQDTLRVEVCIPDCPYVRDEPFIIDLLAADNACPLPQIDTVRLTILVEPPPNEAPAFIGAEHSQSITIDEGEIYSDLFHGVDIDGDNLSVVFDPIGFAPEEFGMSFFITNDVPGSVDVGFEWNAQCLTYNYASKSNFELDVILRDLDVCSDPAADTIHLNLTVDLPLNTLPKITTGVGDGPVIADIDSHLEFDVNVLDEDGDDISLRFVATNFDMQSVGLTFDDQTGVGEIDSQFSWDLDCEVLNIDNTKVYEMYFLAEDEDHCKFQNFDTVKMDIQVNVPFNNKPQFDSYSDYELTINQPFSLDIFAQDADNDFISVDFLDGIQRPDSPSLSFGRVSGEGQVSSTLEWTPECSLLNEDLSPKKHNLFFLVWDERCPIQKQDTLSIIFEIKELVVDYESFVPPNVFTPNGDAHNNSFKLTDAPIPERNLPPDNCDDQFVSISIVDRKGKTVFYSEDRDFEWTGDGAPASTYYYSIRYVNTDYRGTVSILY